MLFEEATKKLVESSEDQAKSGAASGVTPVSPVTTGNAGSTGNKGTPGNDGTAGNAGAATTNGAPGVAPVRKPRGFAAMDRRLVSLIASKGGKAAHKAGTAHEFTSEEARAAGAKGGAHPAHLKAREAEALHAANTTAAVGNDVSKANADDDTNEDGTSR